MTHTKKRILAMLLAVVLMFSALPFSVSADEFSSELPTESSVESQSEETEEPAQTNGTITISDSSGDVPVLYAQDPFNTVKSEVEGGTNYMTSVGVTRQAIVRELEAHENDDFYLGTKYVGGDAQSPNGDASYNSGTVGMNCAGFISYVLRKAGLDAETTMEIMHRTPVNQYGSGLPYDWLAGASNYKNLIENGNISAYAFRTKQELLSSGLAEKGDIILMWWSNSPGADGADNHIGFFWGEASDDDVMWHSGTEPSSGNQISAITPKTPGSFYILIKIEPLQPKDYQVTLTKTSADVSITQGNSAYSLAGATYNVYKGTSGTGSVVATFTTDEAGHAVVVFETLFQGETEIAGHEDIEDEGQTVTFVEEPKIGTTATVDGQHTVEPTGEIAIVDVVEYTGLTPGETYTVSGVLMDKATGNTLLVDGAEVTAEAEFTPESADGTVELTYTLDASTLAGTTIVVFETLYQADVEIAAHADINDENQTVEITEPEKPTLGTTATVDGHHTADPTGEITIVDVVEYTGLISGETYTVSGVLMDKATGNTLLVDGAEVTAEVEFTPESADGTVELTYTLDASTLAGTTIVVFETLYSDGVEIAAHTDINDEAQTITIEPRGGLLIQKTSEDGALEGFTFLVEGEGYSETFTTDGAGKIYIEDLAPGEYSITEQESELTARYEIPAGQTVTVTAEEATTVEFYNRLLRGKIIGHKTGAEQAPLEGVTFGLFDAEVIEFSAENAITTTETDANGEFSFEAPYGDYQVKELETAPGYVTMKESIAVELDKTDVDLEDIANSQTVVHFSKVDAETGEELPGAVLELYAPDGSLLDTWETSDIPHVIPGLPVGEGYILREVTAPEGFEVAEDVTFNVEDTTEIQTITMEDEKTPDQPEEPEEPDTPDEPDEPTPSVPQTGGSRAVIWVSGLLILALLGLCITVPLLRHINKQ